MKHMCINSLKFHLVSYLQLLFSPLQSSDLIIQTLLHPQHKVSLCVCQRLFGVFSSSAAELWTPGLKCDTHTHTVCPAAPSCSCVNTFSSQSHLPFWSSWVCHPFYKQALMTSQQGSSLSEDREWFLVYIACLRCNDSSKASCGLWETLVVEFFYLYLFKGGSLSSFSAPP